jgi:acyl-coenzyme A thioesterase PaaI-like protein
VSGDGPDEGGPRPSLHVSITGRERELRAMADAVRRLVRIVTGNRASAADTASAARRISELADELEPLVSAAPPSRYDLRGTPVEVEDYFPYDPVLGPYNPIALPVRVAWEPPRAVGVASFDTPYEGPPGCVHGAVLAGVFDQVFNAANLRAGVPGPTAELHLEYRRPTPLHAELRFEAWVASVDGRKVRGEGRVLHGDEVTVRATGLFIAVDMERIQKLRGDS